MSSQGYGGRERAREREREREEYRHGHPESASTSGRGRSVLLLDELHSQIGSANPRERYRVLKRVTLSDLSQGQQSAACAVFRRGYVEACLACCEERIRGDVQEDVLVGLQLLAAQGLASGVYDDEGGGELVERVCVRVMTSCSTTCSTCSTTSNTTLSSSVDWRGNDGVYALSMVKFLNKVALGLLARRDDGSEQVCLRVVACMGAVGRAGGREVHGRVCRGVAAMAAHGRCVGGWVGAVIGGFGDDLGGGDACIGSVEAGYRAAILLTIVSTAHRYHLDVWLYVKDVLDRMLAGENNLASLRAERWAAAHPDAIRPHRVEEARYRADAKATRRARLAPPVHKGAKSRAS